MTWKISVQGEGDGNACAVVELAAVGLKKIFFVFLKQHTPLHMWYHPLLPV
jgi:hypothetical protein